MVGARKRKKKKDKKRKRKKVTSDDEKKGSAKKKKKAKKCNDTSSSSSTKSTPPAAAASSKRSFLNPNQIKFNKDVFAAFAEEIDPKFDVKDLADDTEQWIRALAARTTLDNLKAFIAAHQVPRILNNGKEAKIRSILVHLLKEAS